MAHYNISMPKQGLLNEISNMFGDDAGQTRHIFPSTTKMADEPLVYEVHRRRKRYDSVEVEEVVPDDPFKDVEPSNEEYIEPKVELEEIEYDQDVSATEEFNDFNQPSRLIHLTDLQNAQFEEVTNTNEIYGDDFQNDNDAFPDQSEVNNESYGYIEPHTRVRGPDIMCDICNALFSNQKRLRLHVAHKHAMHVKSLIYKCDVCGMAYDKKMSLKIHLKRKHSSEVKTKDEKEVMTCAICSLIFIGPRRLRLHMQRKHNVGAELFKYKCSKCKMSYENVHSLRIHMKRKHTKQKPSMEIYNCQFCPKYFHLRMSYMKHVQTKHQRGGAVGFADVPIEAITTLRNKGNDELVCSHCSLIFADINRLRIHMRRKHNSHSETFQYKCNQCTLSYEHRPSLIQHIKRKHNISNFKCDVCEKQFPNHVEFEKHSHSTEILECSECKMVFSRRKALKIHLKYTHKVKVEPDTTFCHACGAGFPNERTLRAHVKREHTDVHYTCQHCDKVFKLKESFQKHVISKHPTMDSNKDPFVCHCCSQLFLTEVDLSKHITMQHSETKIKQEIKTEAVEKDDNNLQCTKCGESFPNWDKFSYHYKKKHIQKQTKPDVACPHCGIVLAHSEINGHITKNHREKLDTFKCEHCPYTTNLRYKFNVHIVRHTQKARYACTYASCSYKTHYKCMLKKHTECHMEKVKLYCSKCSFSSNNKYTMKYHEEEHVTGKKKYQCDKCDYSTILPANIVQHRYKHSDVKNFRCEKCPFASKYSTALWYHMRMRHSDKPLVRPNRKPGRPKKRLGKEYPENLALDDLDPENLAPVNRSPENLAPQNLALQNLTQL